MSTPNASDVSGEHHEKVFEGRKFDVLKVSIDGGDAGPLEREVVLHPGAVAVLPMLDDETVVMIRNERFAVGRTLWELPAGTLEPGEDPFDCAGRELIEETGYRAATLTKLTEFYTTPGICTERMIGYLAGGLEPVGQDLEPGEKITVETVPWPRAMKMAGDGQIADGKTLAMLLFYDRFRRAGAGA